MRRGVTPSWDLSGRGTTREEDAPGTPTQSHLSPSILVHEEKTVINDFAWIRSHLAREDAGMRVADGDVQVWGADLHPPPPRTPG